MINALICTHKAGDVLPLALAPLLASDTISRVLVADGPSGCLHKAAMLVEVPLISKVIEKVFNEKVVYKYIEGCEDRAEKNNRVLRHVSEDCEWILTVDSDEVWDERELDRLGVYLKDAEYDRYRIQTINPYPDFLHGFEMVDEKPRLYRWFPDAECPSSDRLHQYVLSSQQTRLDISHHWGCALLPGFTFYHLNALRAVKQEQPHEQRRVTDLGDGSVEWKGGGFQLRAEVKPLDSDDIPPVIHRTMECSGGITL